MFQLLKEKIERRERGESTFLFPDSIKPAFCGLHITSGLSKHWNIFA